MDNKVLKELNEMKYLFGYERGRVISEQKEVPTDEAVDTDVVGVIDNDDDIEVLDNPDFEYDGPDFDVESNREIQIPVRPDVDTPTKPKKPGTPYSPKPGPKKNPKADKDMMDVDMPNWLSFDELGLNFDEE